MKGRRKNRDEPGHVYDRDKPVPDHLAPAPEEPQKKRRLKDVDSAEQAFRLKAFTWSLAALPIGGGIGVFVRLTSDTGFWIVPVLAISLWAVTFFGGLAAADSAGKAGSSVYFSSGTSTPPVREYSLADALILRARYDEAVTELERSAGDYMDDPEPCLRLARLLRDEMVKPEEAISWFRQAVNREKCDAATERAALRELIEIYTHRLRTPQRALPDLARLAAKHPNTTAGDWAKRELAEIKQDMRREGEAE